MREVVTNSPSAGANSRCIPRPMKPSLIMEPPPGGTVDAGRTWERAKLGMAGDQHLALPLIQDAVPAILGLQFQSCSFR